jgi:putative Mg2+ transporter-C (MgtC) family protein
MATPSDIDVFLRFLTAVLCGGVIGLERDLRRIPTGFRTMAMVCLGACVAAIAGVRTGDPSAFSRIAQGIVTGIGFLGGGVILRHDKIRHVKGLTTAATIWLTAAIGMMCGIGELKVAIIGTAFAIGILLLDFFGARIWPKMPTRAAEDDFISRDGD